MHARAVVPLTLLRLGKLLAVALFTAGSLACLLPSLTLEQRRVFAYRWAGAGFGLTFILGVLLAASAGHSLLAPFVLGGMATSIVAINGVLYVAGAEGRSTPASRGLVVCALLLAYALMVIRP